MNSNIADKLKLLPTDSGVYIMLDSRGEILYVGKAKNLRNRVRQYFQQGGVKTEKTVRLVEKIVDFNYVVTPNEVDALVLENNLIKEHKPYYNILLKDDKTYPYIKVTLKDKFPRVEVTRRLVRDGGKYYGPYMIGISAKEIEELIQRAFPIRNCKNAFKRGQRECLNYHICRCLAPCTGKTSAEEYTAVVKKVMRFLGGEDKEVQDALTAKLKDASDNLEFELAISYRDALKVLEKVVRKQVSALARDINLDVFAYATNGLYGVINQLVVRGGKLLGAENYPVNSADSADDTVSSYIMQFYDKNPVLADEIVLHADNAFREQLEVHLSAKRGTKVTVLVPVIGVKRQLADMAHNNAQEYLAKTVERLTAKEENTLGAIKQLTDTLGLSRLARRIECYDISNIGGTDTVASMVVFQDGEADKRSYRRFKIRTVKGIDDFASMREVISRRLGELSGGDVSFSSRPDLVVVDGGKGQLSSALEVLNGSNIDLISLAKREEEIFVPHESEPIILSKDSLALRLLQRIRDEAHRFAITFHRTLRGKRQIKSTLTDIEGIGKARAAALIAHFKNIEAIKKATLEQLCEVAGFGRKQAEAVIKHFKEEKK